MKNKSCSYSPLCFDVPVILDEHPFYGFILNEQQKSFRDAIWDSSKLIVFCNARSGTGKTTIAAGTANLLVKYKRYDSIVYIASPVQEQRQGYLKGSLEEKSEPYFEPFYQALNKIGVNMNTAFYDDAVNQKNGLAYISCVTHTFLRGTNFENSVIIIDEAQNNTTSELQKILTRVHDNCKVIVIGHTGQTDISAKNSGFEAYIEHFRGYEQTYVCELTQNYRGWISATADSIIY